MSNVRDRFAGFANVVSVTGSNPYTVTISGFAGNPKKHDDTFVIGDMLVGDVLWTPTNSKFTVTGRVGSVITITDPDPGFSAIPLAGQRIAFVRETVIGSYTLASLPKAGDGNGGAIVGVDTSTFAGMYNHYAQEEASLFQSAISNLSLGTQTTTTVPISNSYGTGVTIPAATSLLAGVMPSADKVKSDFVTITQAVDLDAMELDVTDLTTLTGVASNATNLGTFTGVTIADNSTVKTALQSLETTLETKVTSNTAIVAGTNTKITYDSKGLVTSATSATAADIVNVAAGNISSTTVQAALNELDSEKATDTIVVHLSGAETITGAKTFSTQPIGIIGTSIGNTASGNIAATTVQAAINELDTEKQTNVQFKDEGTSLGTSGTVDIIDFTGAAVTATRVANTLTVNIPATSGVTNLTTGTITTTTVDINSDTGTDATIPAATTTTAGVMTATQVVNENALITLSGNSAGASDNGTFTGTTIADNVTTKVALQSLETSLELKAVDTNVVHLAGAETVTGVKTFTAQPLGILTTSVTEGTNLYYTNARGIGSTLTGFTSGAGVVTATDSILTALQKINGNLAANGNGTVTSLSVVSANGFTGTVTTATTTPAITLTTSVTGLLKGDGTAISAAVAGTDYLTPTGSIAGLIGTLPATAFPALTGEVTTTAGSLVTTVTNSAVIGKVLTGYVSGAGVIAATDNILQSIQKLNGNVTAIGTGASNLALGVTTATTQPITNSNGTGFTLPTSTSSLAGLQSAADNTKLGFITVTGAANLDTIQSTLALKATDSLVVHLSGAETITGIKTFTAQPSGIIGTSIGNTAAGNISSTTTQAAINELDTEKQVNIQFKEEGVNVGTSGAITSIDITGSSTTASVVGTALTINCTALGADAVIQTSSTGTTATFETLELLSGTITRTLPSISGLLVGHRLTYKNVGSGVITLVPQAGQFIDGVSTFNIPIGEAVTFEVTGGGNVVSVGNYNSTSLTSAPPEGDFVTIANASTTTSYTVPVSPSIASGTLNSRVELYLNGLRMRPGATKDFLITSTTTNSITFDFYATVPAPVTIGDLFYAIIK